MHVSQHSDFIVLGGGVAGLTFALEASRRGRTVTVLESEGQVGGLARTLNFGGFRFDVGGHRFHSRWPEIARWVRKLLGSGACEVQRRSRIRLDDTYVDYPLRFPEALTALPTRQAAQILTSYAWRRLHLRPKTREVSFEDWVMRRFGRALYEVYFKPYTEKILGMACTDLAADWASQRIRLPNLGAAIVGSLLRRPTAQASLVSKFTYPPLGIGMLPERIAELATATGRAVIALHSRATRLEANGKTGGWRVAFQGPRGDATACGAAVVSTVPIDALLGMLPLPEADVRGLGHRLPYRSLICVFLAVEGSHISNDTWTYFPNRDVLFGRTHEPGNWSHRMVPEGNTSLCVEVFCSQGDAVWSLPERELIDRVLSDLNRLAFLSRQRVKDAWVLRVPHAYPVYRVGYADALARMSALLADRPSLHLLGRTGTFRYLNLDEVIRDSLELASQLCGQNEPCPEYLDSPLSDMSTSEDIT